MIPQTRRFEACSFRLLGNPPGNGDARCALVARVIDIPASELTPVSEAACRECCRYALPNGPSLNPVLASLVMAESERLRSGISPQSPRRVSLELSRSFAMPWLARGDVGEERGRGTPSRSVSTRGGFEVSSPPASRRTSALPQPAIRVGLVGESRGYGVANINLDIATHLGIDRWLLPATPRLPVVATGCELDLAPPTPSDKRLGEWLRQVDALLFVERPLYESLPRLAKALDIQVVCIPMWEWLDPRQDWLRYVDQMIGTTSHTMRILRSWKKRFGFAWRLEHVPWPVDTQRFAFRPRVVCRRFVHVHGGGGFPGKLQDGSGQVLRRKGLESVLDAARLVPEFPVIVYAPPAAIRFPPRNVEVRDPPADNRLLYADGDVCLLPSHWEGLGLPLLECQAAGMPLITTDHPPMNEHRPLGVVACETQTIELASGLFVEAARFEPADLAETMRKFHGKFIFWQSWRARRFVERTRSWRRMADRIRSVLEASHPASPDGQGAR